MTYKTKRGQDPIELYDSQARELKELREKAKTMDFTKLKATNQWAMHDTEDTYAPLFRHMGENPKGYSAKEAEEFAEGLKMKFLGVFYNAREKTLEEKLSILGKKIDKKLS